MHRLIAALSALLLTVSLASCGDKGGAQAQQPPVAAVTAPAGQDWTQTVTRTDEGFLLGNPNAPVKLVEYGARLCPACKAFAGEAYQPLTNDYVRTGKVSFEFRDFLIHGPGELGLAMLARCVDKSVFFPMLEQNYAGQDAMNAKLAAMTPEQQQALRRGSPAQNVTAWTDAIGGIEFMKERGLPDAKARACLTDEKSMNDIIAVTQKAGGNGTVTGTPTLIVNGAKVDSIAWADVQKALKRAGA